MFSFVVLFAAILVTIYVAMMYESSAIMLLVYMEAALFLVSLCYLAYRRFTIKGKIDVPINISEIGKENLVKVIVKNRSILPINRMKAYVVVENTLNGSKKKTWMRLSEVSEGKNTYIKNVVFPTAGNYEITLKKLRLYDMTGLMYGDVPVKKMRRVQVMPKMHDVPVKLTLAIKNFYGEADVYDEHTAGHDNSELFQVREYQKGDRLQNVHWKMTAKQDEIIVRELSLPKACPVILFLDYHERKKLRSKALAYMESVISISFSLMDAGCPHYVVWYAPDENDIKRVRVDDEETLFYFIGLIMKVKLETSKEPIYERYREKYRHEPYVWALSIDEYLQVKKGDELYATLSEKELAKSLSEMELLL